MNCPFDLHHYQPARQAPWKKWCERVVFKLSKSLFCLLFQRKIRPIVEQISTEFQRARSLEARNIFQRNQRLATFSCKELPLRHPLPEVESKLHAIKSSVLAEACRAATALKSCQLNAILLAEIHRHFFPSSTDAPLAHPDPFLYLVDAIKQRELHVYSELEALLSQQQRAALQAEERGRFLQQEVDLIVKKQQQYLNVKGEVEGNYKVVAAEIAADWWVTDGQKEKIQQAVNEIDQWRVQFNRLSSQLDELNEQLAGNQQQKLDISQKISELTSQMGQFQVDAAVECSTSSFSRDLHSQRSTEAISDDSEELSEGLSEELPIDWSEQLKISKEKLSPKTQNQDAVFALFDGNYLTAVLQDFADRGAVYSNVVMPLLELFSLLCGETEADQKDLLATLQQSADRLRDSWHDFAALGKPLFFEDCLPISIHSRHEIFLLLNQLLGGISLLRTLDIPSKLILAGYPQPSNLQVEPLEQRQGNAYLDFQNFIGQNSEIALWPEGVQKQLFECVNIFSAFNNLLMQPETIPDVLESCDLFLNYFDSLSMRSLAIKALCTDFGFNQAIMGATAFKGTPLGCHDEALRYQRWLQQCTTEEQRKYCHESLSLMSFPERQSVIQKGCDLLNTLGESFRSRLKVIAEALQLKALLKLLPDLIDLVKAAKALMCASQELQKRQSNGDSTKAIARQKHKVAGLRDRLLNLQISFLYKLLKLASALPANASGPMARFSSRMGSIMANINESDMPKPKPASLLRWLSSIVG
jgi:phage shock protein A